MTENKIDHIAIKVDNIETVKAAFEGLGITCGPTETYDEVGMKIAFLDTGESKTELLEVVSEKSPIDKDKFGLHHIAMSTKDINDAFTKMKANPIYEITTDIMNGAHDKKIFFFKIKGEEAVLYEFVQQ